MKKIILITPVTVLLGICSFTLNLEAAGCNSHKNKNVKVECSITDDDCNKTKSEKSFNKVEA